MNKKTALIAGLFLAISGLAVVLIISVVNRPGIDTGIAKSTVTPSAVPSVTPESTVKPGDDRQNPSKEPATSVKPTKIPLPSEPNVGQLEPDDEEIEDKILQLDGLTVVKDDYDDALLDLGNDINEIILRKGAPEHREMYYASDAYIYSDITYLTPYDENEIIQVIVYAPYKFGDFQIGGSMDTVLELFGEPHSQGFSDEDGLYIVKYRIKRGENEYIVSFYAEQEHGEVVAVGIEKYMFQLP